jgi:hypothetical protein
MLYSLWIVRHTPAGTLAAAVTAAEGSGLSRAAVAAATAAAPVPSPFARLPLLKNALPWQRKGLLLQKLRLCSVVFDGVDPGSHAEDREVKRNTLLEVVDFADGAGRQSFSDLRVLEDVFTLVRGDDGGSGWWVRTHAASVTARTRLSPTDPP